MEPKQGKFLCEVTIDDGIVIIVNCLDNYPATNYKKKSWNK